MFRVTIDYIETEFTMEEVEQQVRRKYGDTASVTFSPATNTSESAMDFAIQKLVTKDQLNALFGTRELYPNFKRVLRSKALDKLTSTLDKVIEDNETKL